MSNELSELHMLVTWSYRAQRKLSVGKGVVNQGAQRLAGLASLSAPLSRLVAPFLPCLVGLGRSLTQSLHCLSPHFPLFCRFRGKPIFCKYSFHKNYFLKIFH